MSLPTVVVPGSAQDMERQLRGAGLLAGQTNCLYDQWLRNAAANGITVAEILKIAREFGITPADFAFMLTWTVFTDPDGKEFFLLPPHISGQDAKKAVFMTYILNARTDYDIADDPGNPQDTGTTSNDFQEAPYSCAQATRIAQRQDANNWSYSEGVAFIQFNGGVLVTTPNGMLMGLGGNFLVDPYSLKGGTTWGDVFMLNIDDPLDPVKAMEGVVQGGSQPDSGGGTNNNLDLDRVLHHEETHAQQWAQLGYAGFGATYAWQVARYGTDGTKIPLEQQAGLHDGGYIR